MSKTLRVTILRGGPSAERTVSLASGAAVAAACRRLGYAVTEADIGPEDLAALDHPADVVFPVLHGPFGEDGQLQAILQSRRLCYVGSDAAASRTAMDKDASKRRWQAAGLPTAAWITLDTTSSLALPAELAPPLVVKPLTEGSSIGVSVVKSVEGLNETLRQSVERYGRVLVEKALVGPELTVGILGEEALPIIQVKPPEGLFYDFEAKYQRNDTAYVFEPDIAKETYAAVQALALAAFRALGCRDLSRVDFIVDRTGGPQLLEINTLPGFTDHSLLPKAAAHAGIRFDRLVEMLIGMAFKRGG